MLLIERAKTPFLVLGLPIYVGYYTVHDDKNSQIGFAPHKDSFKPSPSWGILPMKDLGNADDHRTFQEYIEEATRERER